jgi:hypothetical protein
MDLQGASIRKLAPGTEVVIRGALASFPALQLEEVEGSLSIEGGQVLDLGEIDFSASGTLEFELTDGSTDGWDATRLEVDGNVDLTGAVINVTDQGFVPGTYEIMRWTGTLTGTPVIGSVPAGYSGSIAVGATSLTMSPTPSRSPTNRSVASSLGFAGLPTWQPWIPFRTPKAGQAE